MSFTDLLKSGRVIVWDGGMGTALASQGNAKFQISNFKCNEELNILCPEVVRQVHESYLAAGAQVIETNTFGANRITLAEHGLADKVREINIAAVRIAREAIKVIPPSPPLEKGGGGGFEPRFISGSIGPTSKLPTLGHITVSEMVAAYREQAAALIEGGVDIFQIETCQDVLQTKAAIIGCQEAMANPPTPPLQRGARVDFPIIVTFTIEPAGTTLLGTEIGAALAAIEPYDVAAFGLNCSTGPREMEEPLRYLSDYSSLPIAVLPNAGLPEIKEGTAHYTLSPGEFAEWMEYFVRELGVQIVGGCCGTTPEHIAELVKRLNPPTPPLFPPKADPPLAEKGGKGGLHRKPLPQISSLYTAVSIDQQPRPLIIGERMNINGSKEFREAVLADNFEAAAAMAKRQETQGAHVLDLSVAYAGRDEVTDMKEMARRLATASPLPIMIDSTNPKAIEEALSHLGGRSIINSINLEDGGKKAAEICALARRFGAALVALTIDEDGMALTAEKKLSIAKRLIEFCPDQKVLFIDFLTFTLADPKAAEFGSGLHTLEAIGHLRRTTDEGRRTKDDGRRTLARRSPDGCRDEGGRDERTTNDERRTTNKVRTILGISNISYGLRPEARRVLNSVFLHEAVGAGLDAAIVHAGQIMPLHTIDKEVTRLAKDLIYCRRKDALVRFVEYFERRGRPLPPPPLIKGREGVGSLLHDLIIDGDKTGLPRAINAALKKTPAAQIVNKILLPAMEKVGELFNTGDMPLPFVLRSAEAMKSAVDILAPHLKGEEHLNKGKIVLATVRGDVHDIGKNLVDIVLTNNGYKVINLGVKQPIEVIYKAAIEHKADAIGLSGLLVQSCLVMREDLAELAHRGVKIPVICGGAALTKKFVDTELAKAYSAPVYYARDAFDGLRIMRKIGSRRL